MFKTWPTINLTNKSFTYWASSLTLIKARLAEKGCTLVNSHNTEQWPT
jgi:hypothetical protein